MDSTSKPPPQAWIFAGGLFHGQETYRTPVVVAAAVFQEKDKRTDKQINRRTSPSRKVPAFVMGA